MKPLALAAAFAAAALASPLAQRDNAASNASSPCFPYGATFPADGSAPNMTREQWFCPPSQQYGFQGFSYPLEVADCSDASNSFAQMKADFAQMKADFGASIVRLYYPACTQASVFENALRAGAATNMAVIPQVWFGFDGDAAVKNASTHALYAAMAGALAPFVVHSADFGSEPIGDAVDGGPAPFLADLAAFRARMAAFGVPVGISEDWDRPGVMRDAAGTALAATGARVRANSDYAHAHVMPFYHGDNAGEGDAWPYIEPQLRFLRDVVALNGTMVTETQWAWGPNEHYEDHSDVGVPQYTAYWRQFDDQCELFKQLSIGWFLHDWQGESTFDMKYQNGSYVVPGFKPRKC